MSLVAAVEAFLARAEWPYERLASDDPDVDVGDTPVFLTSVRSDESSWPVLIVVAGDGETHLVVQSVLPVNVSAGDEVPAMEVLTRLNDGLLSGCLELDLDDGSIRLRSSMPVRSVASLGLDVLTDVVDELVIGNVETADWALPAVRAVVRDGVAPSLAVAALESGIDPGA